MRRKITIQKDIYVNQAIEEKVKNRPLLLNEITGYKYKKESTKTNCVGTIR